jgi:hypothetical protein
MRKILTFFLLFAAAQVYAAGVPTVMVFGDSLSAGY